MPLTRRDILRFAGAATAGVFLSPLPWKLLDDVSIWTQTGPWIPKLPRGPITMLRTSCALCPAGCPVTARCVSGIPTSLLAVSGSLCPAGLTGHHLAFHPLRVQETSFVHRSEEGFRTEAVSLETALARIPFASAGSVMIVDQRPGRSISALYRSIMADRTNGKYVIPDSDHALMVAAHQAAGAVVEDLGFELDRARIILAVGSPLLDGWATPSRTAQLLRRKTEAGSLRMIIADPRRTRSAALAGRWLPISPNSELALLLGLIHVADGQRRVLIPAPIRPAVTAATPELTEQRTGIPSADIRNIAIELLTGGPSVVLVGGDGAGALDPDTHRLAVVLNEILGASGTTGIIRSRTVIPDPSETKNIPSVPARALSSIPDKSVNLVILDGEEGACGLDWASIERTLDPNDHLVVSFSSFLTRLTAHADIIIPSPAPYESLAEMTGDPNDPVSSYGISVPLHPAKPSSVDPVGVMARLTSSSATTESLLKSRVHALLAAKQGRIVRPDGGSSQPLSAFSSEDELWTALTEGSTWQDEGRPMRRSIMKRTVNDDPEFARRMDADLATSQRVATTGHLTVLPLSNGYGASCSRLSPLQTKLYQESGQRLTSDKVLVAEQTANNLGLEDGDEAELQVDETTIRVRVRVDRSVAPATVLMSSGPDPVGVRSSTHPASHLSLDRRGRKAELRKA